MEKTIIDKRTKGSGASDILQVRIKQSGSESLKTRLDELDQNLSTYLRGLVKKDIGIDV